MDIRDFNTGFVWNDLLCANCGHRYGVHRVDDEYCHGPNYVRDCDCPEFIPNEEGKMEERDEPTKTSNGY